MAICPIGDHPVEDDAEFCPIHGRRLIRERGSSTPVIPAADDSSADAPPTDEAAATDELPTDDLRAEIARRDARIAELEAELAALRRDRTSTGTTVSPQPGDEEPTSHGGADVPGKPPGKKIVRSDDTDSSLEATEYVSPPPQTYGWLIGVGGIVAGQRYAIGPDRIEIGRMKKFADGGIRINDKSVSNPHAFITVENDTVMLHDEGSTNGTFVGNQETERVTKVPLKNGDTVCFVAPSVAEFVFKQS